MNEYYPNYLKIVLIIAQSTYNIFSVETALCCTLCYVSKVSTSILSNCSNKPTYHIVPLKTPLPAFSRWISLEELPSLSETRNKRQVFLKSSQKASGDTEHINIYLLDKLEITSLQLWLITIKSLALLENNKNSWLKTYPSLIYTQNLLCVE